MSSDSPDYRNDPDGLDALLDVLSNERRRFVLGCLRRHDGLSAAELASHVARREHPSACDGETGDGLTGIRTSLHHKHLPALAEADLVVYEHRRGSVAITDRGASVGSWMEEAMRSIPPEGDVLETWE